MFIWMWAIMHWLSALSSTNGCRTKHDTSCVVRIFLWSLAGAPDGGIKRSNHHRSQLSQSLLAGRPVTHHLVSASQRSRCSKCLPLPPLPLVAVAVAIGVVVDLVEVLTTASRPLGPVPSEPTTWGPTTSLPCTASARRRCPTGRSAIPTLGARAATLDPLWTWRGSGSRGLCVPGCVPGPQHLCVMAPS